MSTILVFVADIDPKVLESSMGLIDMHRIEKQVTETTSGCQMQSRMYYKIS